ncbi:MAG TPA: hypothetical protein VMM58_06110 [Bacteroidota bacterium]|nr:hypothetical protein [Bacteroidota bacterium]
MPVSPFQPNGVLSDGHNGSKREFARSQNWEKSLRGLFFPFDFTGGAWARCTQMAQ